ncbi:MAG: fibronectin type III domain-containing protein, partial [Bacteroidales bacterium]|nr:fibronectin type III domain-containing protein [Bacteroidales bacterium]
MKNLYMEFSTKNRENKDKFHSNFFATAFCAAFLLIVSLGAFGQTITINDVTAVNDNEVLIGGTTTDIADGTLLYSYYGTTNDEYSFSMGNAAETNGGVFQINVTALQPGTNYYFQVRDDASGARSNIYEFQTTGTGSTTYTVTTGSHNVSFEIVTLFGTVTPYSSGTIDKVGFIYATDPSMLEMMVQQITIENTMPGNFIEGYVYNEYDGEFKAQLDNLMPDADYYYQACVRSQENGEHWIVANSYESLHTEGGTSTGGNVSWVTIGSDDSSIGELPVNGEYNYSLSQQIYTNAEIDRTGTITKIALYNGNPQMTRTINLYMVSTYKQNFSDLDDWESVSSSNLVFSGEVTFLVSEWTEIELNTPFEYDGTGNIIVVVDDNTGNYESAMNFSAFEATGQSIYVYSDYTDYDATDLSAVTASSIGSVKNQIKFGFMDSSSQTSGDSVNWITIGAGNSTNQNLPVNSYYDYSFSQQIYTYAEIGRAGTIESVAFYNTSYETTRTIDLYMYNTDRQTFTSTNDWEFVDPGDLVFSGEVTFLSDEWTEIPLNTPFEYDGLHNIIIVADDNTVIEATSLSFRVFSATSQAIYYSDYSTDIDPTYLNGTTALDVANVKSQIKFGFTATNPTFSYVDLGLTSGTLWATMNVGAERPEDFGTYFAWGETTTKTIYDWASYTYAAGEADDAPGFTKYCNDASLGNSGFTDELTVLQASDDAATANLGSNWRMPTYDEILELTSECQYSYTTQNGVYGIIVTGPNSNTIFIPAAGGRQFENEVWEEGSGSYWVNSLDTNNPTDAQGLYFESNGFGPISIMR